MGMGDPVNHPDHYNAHPVCEAIDICEHLPFSLGNAVKYLWRAGMKGDHQEDLRKALWYLRRHGAFLRDTNAFLDMRFPAEVVALAKVLHKNPQTPAALRVLFNHIATRCLVYETLKATYAAAHEMHGSLAHEPDFTVEEDFQP
jgi:hypothetical protein